MPSKPTPLWTGTQLLLPLEESVIEEIRLTTRKYTAYSYTLPGDPFKVCARCGDPKAKTEFNVNKATNDGLQNLCRECSNKNSAKDYQENPYNYLAKNCNKRAEKVGASGTIKPAELAKLEHESRGLCFYCSRPFANYGVPHFDHYWPISLARNPKYAHLATNDIANFRVACGPCNRAKGNLLPQEFLAWLDGLKGVSK